MSKYTIIGHHDNTYEKVYFKLKKGWYIFAESKNRGYKPTDRLLIEYDSRKNTFNYTNKDTALTREEFKAQWKLQTSPLYGVIYE